MQAVRRVSRRAGGRDIVVTYAAGVVDFDVFVCPRAGVPEDVTVYVHGTAVLPATPVVGAPLHFSLYLGYLHQALYSLLLFLSRHLSL